MLEISQKSIEEQCKIEIANYTYNVKWLREHHHLTKKQMAKILDISISSLNKLESGTIPPRLGIKIIINIYNNFGIYSEDMFTQRFD